MYRVYPQPAVERTMKIQEVILRAMSKKISWIAAAEVLGMDCRSLRRWRARYQKHGYDGLFDRRKGQPSPKRVPYEEVEKVLGLYRDLYFDLNVKAFQEKLVEKHQITLSYTWVKTALQAAGLVAKERKRKVHRSRRERRPMAGMLLHLDGSPYDWLGIGSLCDLLVLCDDATSEIYEMLLVEEEGTFSCMRVLLPCVQEQGIFCSLYTDRGSHFFFTPKAGEKVDKHQLTQIGRALAELRIEHIAAYSPQARGRSERLFRTLQGRLPQELRLRGITTLAEANAFLHQEYIPDYNKRFARASRLPGKAFLSVPKELCLERIFCLKEERRVNNDNTVAYKNQLYSLKATPWRCCFAKCQVTVYEYLDGTIAIGYGPQILQIFPKEVISTYPQLSTKKEKEAKRKKPNNTNKQIYSHSKRTDHLLQKADTLTCY